MLRTHGKKRNGAAVAASGAQAVSVRPAEFRVRKELVDLECPPQCAVKFSNEVDCLNFQVIVKPDDGYWKGGTFIFNVTIPPSYPHDPPKVRCDTKVFHPNINLEGAVCLNILRAEWRPVLSIYAIIVGLLHLFLEPEVYEPLNQDAANELMQSKGNFANLVRQSMLGGRVNGEAFPKVV
eukprot:Gregarina_sp_Poly_1__2388@NODE_163_length_12241_cov_147_232955_g145_i0_p8_GENE_NODE_163_length_12241_cov_147_232955_g145_i0NODE_163_length_12241_cov_147_232955_g145_i0_p8_ORF_typecomplete_len180_score25_68UQ_con/PF00179_26/9_1e35ProkE2_B/PF14461_6/7_8e07RWD/PF05773_22/0_021_NODE_163_length_12241_cov_147_232955_g145_i031783717